ncbi:MAG: hypothetical protein ACM336_16300 [Acidobacteriota bacterium]
MKRSNISIAIYMALVFLSGVVLGGVGDRLFSVHSVSATKGNPCTADAVRRRYVDELTARLDLTPGQVKELKGILETIHHRYRALREKYKPELKEIQGEQASAIRAILNDKQRVEFEKVRQEREKAAQASQK